MDLNKAVRALRDLADSGVYDLQTFAQVQALLAGFERKNRDNDGSMIDAYHEEKIRSVRGWFAMLCGVGEDGYTPEKALQNVHTDIAKLAGIVREDGVGLGRQ